jgi:hypothetical protein
MSYFKTNECSTHNRNVIVQGYATWVENKVAEGWIPHLISALYHPLRGGALSVIRQMRELMERLYGRYLTWTVKNPHAIRWLPLRPILIGCADLPVPKRDKQPIADFQVNGGLHTHATLLTAPQSRLKVPVEEHFASQAEQYRRVGRLRELEVKAIDRTPANATEYVLKAFKTGRVPDEALIILPRATGEAR